MATKKTLIRKSKDDLINYILLLEKEVKELAHLHVEKEAKKKTSTDLYLEGVSLARQKNGKYKEFVLAFNPETKEAEVLSEKERAPQTEAFHIKKYIYEVLLKQSLKED